MWELREGLRKRGESWHKWPDEDSTTWQAYSNPHTATESMDGTLIVTGLTPAQAISATLGAGTCHNTQFAEMDEKAGKKYSMAMTALRFGGFMPEDEPAEFECSACGKTALIDWETLYDIRFCPLCGAKVVDA